MKKDDIVEIKKNMVGCGLLVENDGYASLDMKKYKNEIKEGIGDENGWYVPNPFVVDAVFQKFGIKNANGRIYPENVLKREVEKYQIKINEKRALGECYKPDAMILTESGWKTLENVELGEKVLTLNTSTMEIEIHPILRKIEKEWDGDMIHIHNRNIDDVVTPNHEYILLDRNGKYYGRHSAEDILERRIIDQNKKYIPKRGIWNGKDDEFFVIKNLSTDRIDKMHKYNQKKYSSDLVIPMTTFAKFMGIYLSEGCCDKTNDGNRVFIYQRKKDVADKIDNLLKELGLPYTVNEKHNEDGTITYIFLICDMRLCNYLKQFGLCYDKFIPIELKQQKKETLKEFYEWFVLGDGRVRGDKRLKNPSLSDDVFSTSKQLALDLNEIQLKLGFSGNFHKEDRENDRYIGNGIIEGKNSKPLYFTFRSTVKHGITLDERFLRVEKEHYTGKVMCVEVENHNFYVMCNGKCHWTSNCNHPSDSTINLSRVSHNIIELHWEGRTLVGKMELNTSEGFRKQGIITSCGDEIANLLLHGYKIGVSSRGLGSVEQKLGQYVVGDDFELVCWDVVSDPSTPNAYISANGEEELAPYLESSKKDEKKGAINEKIAKIKEILS